MKNTIFDNKNEKVDFERKLIQSIFDQDENMMEEIKNILKEIKER